MSRPISKLSLHILRVVAENPRILFHNIINSHIKGQKRKTVYDTLFRLVQGGYLTCQAERYSIASLGQGLIHKVNPRRDGVWKVIIFDIPESQRQVRNFLRQKLASLGFKKWQNSIWVSPYELPEALEQELTGLAKKYFIRLIKTWDINYTGDLDKLFPK